MLQGEKTVFTNSCLPAVPGILPGGGPWQVWGWDTCALDHTADPPGYFLSFFSKSIELVTTLLLFYALFFWLRGMWDLLSQVRDGTPTPCIGSGSFQHWSSREVPLVIFLSQRQLD